MTKVKVIEKNVKLKGQGHCIKNMLWCAHVKYENHISHGSQVMTKVKKSKK